MDNTVIEYGSGLLYLREQAEEMIDEDVTTTYNSIPENAFFFATTLAAHYWFFICDTTINPDVYYLTIGESKYRNYHQKLSDFIIRELQSSLNKIRAVES
jgi:hypothetical protein